MESEAPRENVEPKDISQEFQDMPLMDFLDFLHQHRKEAGLRIKADLSGLERNEFVGTARRLKAFLESGHGQPRAAEVICSEEQKMWEPNVFSSGVKWIEG